MTPRTEAPWTDADLVRLMAAELDALDEHPTLVFEPNDFLRLVGLLQLASRHPQVDGLNAGIIEAVVATAQDYFVGCPAVLEVIRRGEDQRYDA